jgi:tRNA uridine 5-carbamoylmethylation protein Kti12
MFEKLSRMKARFDSPQGNLTIEDLWDIPLVGHKNKANLDDIARGLSKQVKESETESFVVKPPKSNQDDLVKFEAVKHVIAIRLAENDAAKVRMENKQKKHQLLQLITQKENEQLAGQSIDDLRKMVEEL